MIFLYYSQHRTRAYEAAAHTSWPIMLIYISRVYPRPETVDWTYIGAKYYDRAISLLMEELSNSGGQDVPMTPMGEDVFTPKSTAQSPRSISNGQGNKRRRLSRPAQANNADETLAAAAILCVYEFLDNANTAWARHLSGTKSLFDMAENEGMMPVQSPTSPGAMSQRIKPSRARKATFWNFARQDFLAACKFLGRISSSSFNPINVLMYESSHQ
jgi:hypothetical protein